MIKLKTVGYKKLTLKDYMVPKCSATEAECKMYKHCVMPRIKTKKAINYNPNGLDACPYFTRIGTKIDEMRFRKIRW